MLGIFGNATHAHVLRGVLLDTDAAADFLADAASALASIAAREGPGAPKEPTHAEAAVAEHLRIKEGSTRDRSGGEGGNGSLPTSRYVDDESCEMPEDQRRISGKDEMEKEEDTAAMISSIHQPR